jgi:hypothetical protein
MPLLLPDRWHMPLYVPHSFTPGWWVCGTQLLSSCQSQVQEDSVG